MGVKGRIRYEQLNENSITSKLATKEEIEDMKVKDQEDNVYKFGVENNQLFIEKID